MGRVFLASSWNPLYVSFLKVLRKGAWISNQATSDSGAGCWVLGAAFPSVEDLRVRKPPYNIEALGFDAVLESTNRLLSEAFQNLIHGVTTQDA